MSSENALNVELVQKEIYVQCLKKKTKQQKQNNTQKHNSEK